MHIYIRPISPQILTFKVQTYRYHKQYDHSKNEEEIHTWKQLIWMYQRVEKNFENLWGLEGNFATDIQEHA